MSSATPRDLRSRFLYKIGLPSKGSFDQRLGVRAATLLHDLQTCETVTEK